MTTRTEWQQLAEDRILDAQAHLDPAVGRWSAAYYLIGYAVECGLKSCVLALVGAHPEVIYEDRRFSQDAWMWAVAASYEERIAPLLDALGRDLEAAASRISAASCYQKGGDLSRAANLYQAALAAPLCPRTRREVEGMLARCLDELSRTVLNGLSGRGGKVPAET